MLFQPLDDMDFTNWVTHVGTILAKYNLEYLMYNQYKSLPLCGYKNIKQKVLSRYEIFFKSLIQNVDKYPKLRTYEEIKLTFQYEPYLKLQIPKYRTSVCELRTSSYQLEIE